MALETRRRRRPAVLARNCRIHVSPDHNCRNGPGQTPRNRGVSATSFYGPRFAEMRVVVQAVCSEPVSAEFPVKQGKNREFSQNHPLIRPVGRSNRLVSLVFSVEFPKRRNREFFQRNRELSGGSGNRRTGSPQPQIGGPKPPGFDTPTRRDLESAIGPFTSGVPPTADVPGAVMDFRV